MAYARSRRRAIALAKAWSQSPLFVSVVQMGDLLHGDKHGVTSIPLDIAEKIPDMVQTIAEYERQTIELCQSPGFSMDQLKEVAKITRPY